MGESGILAGVVADGAGSVSIQTAAPAGVDVMVSLPGKSAGTGVSGVAGTGVATGPGGRTVRETAGIDDGAMTAAATSPAVRRQQRRRRVRVSIDEVISGIMRLRFRPGGPGVSVGSRGKCYPVVRTGPVQKKSQRQFPLITKEPAPSTDPSQSQHIPRRCRLRAQSRSSRSDHSVRNRSSGQRTRRRTRSVPADRQDWRTGH